MLNLHCDPDHAEKSDFHKNEVIFQESVTESTVLSYIPFKHRSFPRQTA